MSFDWWYNALDGNVGQMTTTPEEGYYKTRRKGGPFEPVAIWEQDGTLHAHRNGQPVEAKDIENLWLWSRAHPVTHDAYLKALAEGVWDDDDPTVAAAFSGVGHNVGDISELDLLRDQIESARQGAEVYAKITSDDQAAKAQSLRARLNELAGTADKKREALKKPFFEAGKQIDKDWMPLVKEAKEVANTIRAAIAAHETVKLQERRRLEMERQREETQQTGEPVAPPQPPTDAVKGSYGRAASVGTELVVTEIVDQDALYQFLREHPDLRACLLQLGQRALRAGHNPPGVKVEERAKIS